MAKQAIKSLMSSDLVKGRFEEILGEKASAFVSSVINTVSQNKLLENAEPNTILQAAAVAATLDLPIDPNLGFAYIVPYKGKAQFQMGYKGFVQLAQRTGQYKSINVIEIRESNFKGFNPMTEEINLDFSAKTEGEVVGYAAYFKLLNGFEKTVFWTKEEVEAHGKRYSQSYNSSFSPWQTDFDSMAKKTVLKSMLSKWGVLSTQMQKAELSDQGVINNNDTNDITYEDLNAPEIAIEVNKEKKEELNDSHPMWPEMVKKAANGEAAKIEELFVISEENRERLLDEAMNQ